jgi:hypothetical protein
MSFKRKNKKNRKRVEKEARPRMTWAELIWKLVKLLTKRVR